MDLIYSLSKRLSSKRAFVTGAGSGLGRQFCIELARDGWAIGIADIDGLGLTETATQITENGGKSWSFVLNVADQQSYADVVVAFLKLSGGIDLLINNAGVGDGGLVGEYLLENWHWMVNINQMGVIYGCHYFLPAMKHQNSGHIINIASAAAFSNAPAMGAYSMTKAAVLSLSETLHSELRGTKVRVSVVMPTFFRTNITQHRRQAGDDVDMIHKIMDQSPVSANDVARIVLAGAGKEQFYIVLPRLARVLFFIKRLMPNVFFRLLPLLDKKKEQIKKQLQTKQR